MAACSAIALEKRLWEKVIPSWKEQVIEVVGRRGGIKGEERGGEGRRGEEKGGKEREEGGEEKRGEMRGEERERRGGNEEWREEWEWGEEGGVGIRGEEGGVGMGRGGEGREEWNRERRVERKG